MVRLKKSPDLIAVGAAGLIFVVTVVWFIFAQISAKSNQPERTEIVAGVLALDPVVASSLPEAKARWATLPQSDDPDVWQFEVFTPPRIYFDPNTGRFSVSTPEAVELAEEPLQTPFGVSLLAVERQPYRLQLVGYAGEREAPWGIFANEVTGEGIVAQRGFRFAGLDLELRELEIRREDLIVPDSMPLREIVAVAMLEDQRDRRVVRLTSGYPAWTDRPKATIRFDATGETREVEAGNRLELGDAVVEITGVFSGPDAVTAVKILPDGSRETMRLSPDNSPDPQFGSDTLFETP